jgi:hypothetical protein
MLSEESSLSIVLPKLPRYHCDNAATCFQKEQFVSPQTEAAIFSTDTCNAEDDCSSEKTSAVACRDQLKRIQRH